MPDRVHFIELFLDEEVKAALCDRYRIAGEIDLDDPWYPQKREIAILGGIDVDFLCRSDQAAVRQRVRALLSECHPSGGYCLGTGNSIANNIPLEN